MYERIRSFFMTGTGNSYLVAKWFADSFKNLTKEFDQVTEKQAALDIQQRDLLVLSYPTHGFTAPLLMMKHVFRLPKGAGIHAAVLPTRAGTRIMGLSLPGMEGTAAYLIALLLWLRGYRVRGVSAIDMPSNWTAVHWGLSSENAQAIAGTGRAKVERIAHEIAAGRTYYGGFIPLAIGLLLARISFMYVIIAQLILAKLFFASHRCNGCGLCERLCPKNSITMTGRRPYWGYSCDSCMACMNFCPQRAIQTSPFTVFLFSYVLSLPVTSWLTSTMGYPAAGLPGILKFLLNYVYTLASISIVYWLLHRILRWKPAAALLERLSHTRYFRRYRAPGVSLEDIHLRKKP